MFEECSGSCCGRLELVVESVNIGASAVVEMMVPWMMDFVFCGF